MNSKRLSELRYKGHITDSEYKELKLALKALEERPQGEWLSRANGNGINCGRKCSLCGKVVEFSENFCPNCGADMRGDKND